MMRLAPLAASRWQWLGGLAIGLAIGLATAFPLAYVIAAFALVAAAAAFARSTVRTELLVAVYWIAFCLFSTMWADRVVSGLYYPFYAAFLIGAIATLATTGLRIPAGAAWAYVAFLFVIVASLLGSTESIGTRGLERLIIFPLGALVFLQFRSSHGLRTVAWGAIVASLAVSLWVIATAVQSDFAYRGNIDANENVVSFYIALGAILAFAERLHGTRGGRVRAAWATVVLGLALGIMAYALVLLASRGMIVGLALAIGALLIRVTLLDRRRLPVFVVLGVVAAAGLLLPGGQGIVERFENPNVATGGGRTLIWAAIGEAWAQANVRELLIGHGHQASRFVVERRFAPISSSHNAYLQVLFEQGLVGLTLFLTLHAYVIARSWIATGRDGARMLGLVVFLLGANLFMSTTESFLYWTTLGFALAITEWYERASPGNDGVGRIGVASA